MKKNRKTPLKFFLEEFSLFFYLPFTFFIIFFLVNTYSSILESVIGQFTVNHFSYDFINNSNHAVENFAQQLYNETTSSLFSLGLMLLVTMITVGVILVDSKKPISVKYYR